MSSKDTTLADDLEARQSRSTEKRDTQYYRGLSHALERFAFSRHQTKTKGVAEAGSILRTCPHCGESFLLTESE